MQNALVLALDIGTSSLRSALFDGRGQRLFKTTAQEAYSLRVKKDGTAELAVADLEQAASRAIDKSLHARRQMRGMKNRPIVAVTTSCFWHSLLGYDARRDTPTPIYTWADARCRDDAHRLRGRLHEKSYHARTGAMLRTPYWPAKLAWLTRTGRAKGITQWMSPAEWLYRRLAGISPLSLSMASGTGLLNLRTGDWDDSLLRLLKIEREMLGTISDEPMRALDLPAKASAAIFRHARAELKDALWFPAIGDGAASNLGSGATQPGEAALNVGTSAALRMIVPRVPAGLATGLFCHRVDAGRCVLGGAISNAGNLRKWALEHLLLPDQPGRLERALAERQRPNPELSVLPFWTDERCPTWPEAVGGTITGITYATTALDLLQAVVESSYHRLAQIADLLAQQGPGIRSIVLSGGVRHSPESMQRLANVLGRAVRPCQEPEASLRGAAVYALEALGFALDPLPTSPVVRPNQAAAREYAIAREAQIKLEKNLCG